MKAGLLQCTPCLPRNIAILTKALYAHKAYTGPLGSNPNATNAQDSTTTRKRSDSGSDEEEEACESNAVPTDFTSREAKVLEAKSKATERNWKKRKEEEMICKLCGESGHFTQPREPTLVSGKGQRKRAGGGGGDKDMHVEGMYILKSMGSISYKRFANNPQIGYSQHFLPGKWSRSPERKSTVSSWSVRSNFQRSNPSPHNALRVPHRSGRQEKDVEDCVHEDLQKLSRGSLQAVPSFSLYCLFLIIFFAERAYHVKAASIVRDLEWKCLTRSSSGEAYGNDGDRGRSSHSRSPVLPSYLGNPYNSYDGHSQSRGSYRFDGLDADRRGWGRELPYLFVEFDYAAIDSLHIGFFKFKAVREIREGYMKKLAMLRGAQAKQWQHFLQADVQRRQRASQHISASGFSNYRQPSYPEYDNSSGNAHYSGPGTNIPMESTGRYPNSMENYPSRPHVTCSDFQHKRSDEFGNSYNLY
ncbi:unnamed protein product [Fraxinus pennsylvanica]|uniref:Uncharacterized protein n=1 Tax=Fraxinus pennsylvanica TaxID=56036 RepID=A0AAD2DYI6_9LAMI|nr:unnamed protein product [Fraxinus pennsylvanica]